MNVNDLNRLIKEHKRLLGVQQETVAFGSQASKDLEVLKGDFSVNLEADRRKLADIEQRIRLAELSQKRVEVALESSEAALRDGLQSFVDDACREASRLYDSALVGAIRAFRPLSETEKEAEELARLSRKPRRILQAAENLKHFILCNHPLLEGVEAVIDQWSKAKAAFPS